MQKIIFQTVIHKGKPVGVLAAGLVDAPPIGGQRDVLISASQVHAKLDRFNKKTGKAIARGRL